MSSKLAEAKAALAAAEKEARKLDKDAEELKAKRRAVARRIEAATAAIRENSPPNPVPALRIGG